MPFRMRNFRILSAALLLACTTCGIAADGPAPPPASPSEAQIRAWVRDLGSEDFDTRTAAEEKLLGAPPLLAKAPLENALRSKDAEVVLRARRVQDRHFWLLRPPLPHPANAFPAATFAYLGTRSVADLWKASLQDSELGRRCNAQPLKEGLQALWDYSWKDSKAETKALIDRWQDRYGGPAAWAWYHDKAGEPVGLGLLGVGRGIAPQEINLLFNRCIESTQRRNPYRGLAVFSDVKDKFAVASVNGLLLTASNDWHVARCIDRLADDAHPSYASDPTYREAREKLGGEPLAQVCVNIRQFLEAAEKAEDNKADLEAYRAMGFGEWPYGTWGLSVRDGLFVERIFCKCSKPLGLRKGFPQLLSFSRHDANLAAFCPPEVHGFLSLPIKGSEVWPLAQALGKACDWGNLKDFVELLEDEDHAEAKKTFERIVSLYAGETAIWGSPRATARKTGIKWTVGDYEFFAVLDAASEADAQELAGAAARFLNQFEDLDELALKSEHERHTCYTFNKDLLNEDLPYAYSWCADGCRVLFATSPDALKVLIARAAHPPAGLDTSPDYQRLITSAPDAERGAVAYVNMEAFLNWAYPSLRESWLAEDSDLDAALKAACEKLPKDPRAVTKGFPGLLASCAGCEDGFRFQISSGFSPGFYVSAMTGLLLATFPH